MKIDKISCLNNGINWFRKFLSFIFEGFSFSVWNHVVVSIFFGMKLVSVCWYRFLRDLLLLGQHVEVHFWLFVCMLEPTLISYFFVFVSVASCRYFWGFLEQDTKVHIQTKWWFMSWCVFSGLKSPWLTPIFTFDFTQNIVLDRVI